MLEKLVEQYINKQNLLSKDKSYLVAVSGGIDSTCLAYILKELGYQFEIAHCNFMLRGKEASEDEEFVKKMALHLNVKFHITHFNTKEYAEANKLSTQVAARDLRYNYFEKILLAHKLDKVIVGTNANDNIETYLYNSIKGSGLKGIRGIQPKNGNVIRPLLETTRQQIEAYSSNKKIEFRNDSSNSSNKYSRNNIRHNIVPVLKEINPSLETTFNQTFKNLQDTYSLFKKHVALIYSQLCEEKNNSLYINFNKLVEYQEKETILFEFISPFGFNTQQVMDVFTFNQTGKFTNSKTHSIIYDRKYLVISPLEAGKKHHQNINEIPFQNEFIQLSYCDTEDVDFTLSPATQYLDADNLSFPLTFRNWEHGDKFSPLGMEGKKKVSDFLTDIKTPHANRNKICVLTSGQNIISIIGLQTDNKVRISNQTKSILKITTT